MTEPVNLLDGNILVALAIRAHEHHQAAVAWYQRGLMYATCPADAGLCPAVPPGRQG